MRIENENHLAWIALNGIPLRPLTRARLVESCGGPAGVFRCDRERLRASNLKPETVHKIVDLDWKSSAEKEIEVARKHNIHILSPELSIFPSRLVQIPDPPAALYVRGRLVPEDELSIAVVGAREASTYGVGVAERLGHDLAARGVTVVSGLARGIDAAAHRGALDSGGRTVAFLGCGLDQGYPRRNLRLRERIAASGAVLSEFPLGTEPLPWHFPQRNRLIAAFTLGTVVVEAAKKSGSLITADHAMDFGRDVFAVPGRVTSRGSAGTHGLLRQGAVLVRDAEDVVSELREEWRRQVRDVGQAGSPDPVPEGLPDQEVRVLARLNPGEPVAVDALAREARLPLATLLDALVSLEVRRLVRSVPGGRYVRAPH